VEVRFEIRSQDIQLWNTYQLTIDDFRNGWPLGGERHSVMKKL